MILLSQIWAASATYNPTQATKASIPSQTTITVNGGDSDDIQAAIDALPGNGGTVYLSNGTYTIYKPIVLRSSIRLAGESQSGVILERDESFILSSQNGMLYGADGVEDIIIDHLSIDGSMSAAYRTESENPVIGIYMNAGDNNRNNRIYINRCTVKRCAMGIHIKGTDNLKLYLLTLDDNGSINYYSHNLYLRRCTYVTMTDCVSVFSSTGNGFQSTDSDHVTVKNCTFKHNGYRGLRFAGNSSMILASDNESSYNNEADLGDGAYGIGTNPEGSGSPSQFSIINNKVQSNDYDATGISVSGSNGQIEDNICRWNPTNYKVLGNNIVCDYSTDEN